MLDLPVNSAQLLTGTKFNGFFYLFNEVAAQPQKKFYQGYEN